MTSLVQSLSKTPSGKTLLLQQISSFKYFFHPQRNCEAFICSLTVSFHIQMKTWSGCRGFWKALNPRCFKGKTSCSQTHPHWLSEWPLVQKLSSAPMGHPWWKQMGSCCCCSVAKSCPALCELQHTRLHYPSPSPGVCSNSCPLS